jgi:NAD+ synthase
MSNNTFKDNIIDEISKWLNEYLKKSGKNGFVFGMSGGVDSSVIALLAKEALKRSPDKKLLALLLPIRDLNKVDYYDEKIAMDIVKSFSIPYKLIDLTNIYQGIITLLDKSADAVCYTNLKARLRMSVIYFYANMLNYLVLGTVNKGEFYIGYFPKNASAGDILPIGGLLKKEIREIGKKLGLPSHIVQRKASGCIWAPTAEEEWGFTEDELDLMIELHEKGGNEGLLNEFEDSEKARIFLKKYQESEHKRKFYPIYKKLT